MTDECAIPTKDCQGNLPICQGKLTAPILCVESQKIDPNLAKIKLKPCLMPNHRNIFLNLPNERSFFILDVEKGWLKKEGAKL